MNAQERRINDTLTNLNRLYRNLGTWQAVADWTACNRATVNKWFAGTRKPNEDACARIARVVDYLRA